MNRPLHELKTRGRLLARYPLSLREMCVDIAREKSPSATFSLAQTSAILAGFGRMDALSVAKATRWLAVIRRDHGDEEFDSIAKTLV